jgi:hypothetical protein
MRDLLALSRLDAETSPMITEPAMTPEDPMPDSPTLREAATAVSDQADPDDDWEGEFYQYLVPHDAIRDLRAALATTPPLDVELAVLDRLYEEIDAYRQREADRGKPVRPAWFLAVVELIASRRSIARLSAKP